MPDIPLEKDQFWFRSTLFEIEVGEDKETNPLCYGRQLANWLVSALRSDGITVEGIFPEDWGWCVMVRKTPFSLWVGCGSVCGDQQAGEQLPRGTDVVWTCIVVAEVALLKRLFRAPDTAPKVAKLFMRVKHLVTSSPGTTLVEEPLIIGCPLWVEISPSISMQIANIAPSTPRANAKGTIYSVS